MGQGTIMRRLDYQTAVQYKFPATPAPGQVVIDTSGQAWKWHEDGSGLADLGFWGTFAKVLGGVTGLFSGKGGGSSKETQAILQQNQQMLEMMRQQQEQQSKGFDLGLSKKTIMLLAVGVLAFVALRK